MVFYYKAIDEILGLPKEKRVDFVRFNMTSLCESLVNHCKEWLKCLGQQLNELARKRLNDIKIKLEVNLNSLTLAKFHSKLTNF